MQRNVGQYLLQLLFGQSLGLLHVLISETNEFHTQKDAFFG
jgi:hypothetical protein